MINREDILYIRRATSFRTIFIEFINTKNNKHYDVLDFRMESLNCDFDLGEDFARNGLTDLRFVEGKKIIVNTFFDYLKGKERYFITKRVDYFENAHIKLPNIIYRKDNENHCIGCIVTINKDGIGTLTTMDSPYPNNKSIMEGDIYSEADLNKIDKELIENKEFINIYVELLKEYIKDLKVNVYKDIFYSWFFVVNNDYSKDDIQKLLKEFKIIDSNYKYNELLNNKVFDISDRTDVNLLLTKTDMIEIAKSEDETQDFLDNFCFVRYYFVERNRLSRLLDETFENVEDLDGIYNKLEVEKMIDQFNFTWSNGIKKSNLAIAIKRIFGIDDYYGEFKKMFKYKQKILENNEKKIEEEKQTIQDRITKMITVITLIISTISIFELIDTVYGVFSKDSNVMAINMVKIVVFLLCLIGGIIVYLKTTKKRKPKNKNISYYKLDVKNEKVTKEQD